MDEIQAIMAQQANAYTDPLQLEWLVGGLGVFALGIAALSVNDPTTLLAALFVALCVLYYECYVTDGSLTVRIAVAVASTVLLTLFARKAIFYPAPLVATPETSAQLAKAESEQDVRDLIAGNARAFRSIMPSAGTWSMLQTAAPLTAAPTSTARRTARRRR